MQSDLKAILDQLTDETDDRPIELINDRGEKACFSQMALIPVTTPSREFEDEFVEHHFALLQPLNEEGEDVGEYVVFDFVRDENGEIGLSLVEDPYVMRDVLELYRQRGNHFEQEETAEECDSIFGGTVSESADRQQSSEESLIDDKELELQKDAAPRKADVGKKRNFLGKLFGKK